MEFPMFKKILTILAIPLCLLGCSEQKTETTRNKKVISVATCADYPPFEFLQNGEIVGFDIDLLQAVADKLGFEIQINDMSFDGILGSLQSNRIDLAISALTPTPERQKAVDFSDEYYSTEPVVVCSDLSPVHNVTNLTNLAIGVQAGSIYEAYANQDLQQITRTTVKSLPRVPELVQELKSRRISCILMGEQEAEALMRNNEGLRLVKIETNKAAGFAIAMPKGSPLREEINTALIALKANGTLDKIKAKWLK